MTTMVTKEGENDMINANQDVETLRLGEDVIAAENKRLLEANGVVVINVIGEPGAGKATVLEKILPILANRLNCTVIDIDNDMKMNLARFGTLGVEVIRINVNESSTSIATEINKAIRQLSLGSLDLIVIRNGSSIACASDIDLGSDLKIVVTSVTEGLSVIKNNPETFKKASIVLINKIDMLPYEKFSFGGCLDELTLVNELLKIFPVSALHGEGIEELSSFMSRAVWKKRRNIAA